MRGTVKRHLASVVSAVISTSLLGCAGPPTAPSLSAPLRAAFAGDYTLTVQIDEGCVEFESRRVWAYRAILEDLGYLSVRVLGGAFTEPTAVGQLYVFDNSQFRFLLNIHDELFDRIPASQELLIYGAGDATGTASSISGVFRGTASLLGRSGNPCAGSHSFTFVRQAGRDAHDIEVRSQ